MPAYIVRTSDFDADNKTGLLHCLTHAGAYRIPYSGKLSREKTFTNFVDLMPF